MRFNKDKCSHSNLELIRHGCCMDCGATYEELIEMGYKIYAKRGFNDTTTNEGNKSKG